MPSFVTDQSEKGRPTFPFAERRSSESKPEGQNSEARRQETQRPRQMSPQSSSSSLDQGTSLPRPDYSRNLASRFMAGNPYEAPRHHLVQGHSALGLGNAIAQQYGLPADSLYSYQQQGDRKRSFEYEDDGLGERYQSGRKYKRRRGSQGKQAERWDQMFQRLLEFKRIHGHCLVPNRYPLDPSLGAWVSTQRRHYKILIGDDDSVTTPMTPERASRLMSIGFQWATKDPRHVPWETRFQELLAYKEEYGDCIVPIGWKENPRLSNWVSAQRQEYKLFKQGKKCRITADRVAALDAVGFVWEAQRGSSHQQQKKKKIKDAKVGKAAVHMLTMGSGNNGHAIQARSGPIPNDPTGAIPPDVLRHVMALMEEQKKQNGALEAQIRAESAAIEAARRMEDAAAIQRLTDYVPPPPSSQLLSGIAHHLPPHERALLSRASLSSPAASLGATASLYGDSRARQLQDAADLRLGGTSQNQDRPMSNLDQEIITKHLLQALNNDQRARSVGVDTAVSRIQDILGIHGISASDLLASQIPQNDAERFVLSQQLSPAALASLERPAFSLPGQDSRKIPAEPESEASKFAAALRVGDIVGGQDAKPVAKSPSEGSGTKVPAATIGNMQRTKISESLQVKPSLSAGLDRPKEPKGVGGILSTTARGSTGNGLGAASNSPPKNLSPKSSSSTESENDDGGVFSDAEEDESATAFLTAARRL